MEYPDYNEHTPHGTPDRPIACYYVDEKHPRYRMPMHWHIECEIVRVKRGVFRLYVDDARITAKEDDVVFIARGAIHGGEPEGCVYECVVFDAALMGGAPCAEALSPLISRSAHVRGSELEGGEEFGRQTDRLFEFMREGTDSGLLQAVGCLYLLYGQLAALRMSGSTHSEILAKRRKTEQLKPALEYIESHYGQHVSLDALARLTGLSPKYFCRAFRNVAHRSPIDYLNFYRVECAAALLASSDLTVAEVAYHCGFNDSSFFIKQFRRYKDMTPGEYRETLNR